MLDSWGDTISPVGSLYADQGRLFHAEDWADTWGTELWVLTQSTGETALVFDVNPGRGSSNPSVLGRWQDLLFFKADDGTHGMELWKHDLSTGETALVKDIAPGRDASGPLGSDPYPLLVTEQAFYFRAFHPDLGIEMWKTDGTPAGTVLTADLDPQGDSFPMGPVELGGGIYFSATVPETGQELWRYDPSSGETTLVRDINPGGSSGVVAGATVFNDAIYFPGRHPETGVALWKSDGTAAGTSLVKDTNPALHPAQEGSPENLTVVGGFLYFSAADGVNGRELWRSDGTRAGTALVADINKTEIPTFAARALASLAGNLFFTATDCRGDELWRSDGSLAQTRRVTDINRDAGSLSGGTITPLGAALYFAADDGVSGMELWRHVPGAEETIRAADINPSGSSFPGGLAVMGESLYFAADDGATGQELWRYTPGTGQATRLADLHPSGSSSPANLMAMGGTLYFTADDGTTGEELYNYVATTGETARLADLNPSGSSSPANLTPLHGALYFTANDGVNGIQLYRHVPSTGETGVVNVSSPQGLSWRQMSLTVFQGALFGKACSSDQRGLLFKIDGTGGSSVWLQTLEYFYRELPPFAGMSCLSDQANLVEMDGYLYFSNSTLDEGAPDIRYRNSLMRTDGTPGGAEEVKLFSATPVGPGNVPRSLTPFNRELHFALTTDQGTELWRSDGTEEGTTALRDPILSSAANPRDFYAVGRTLFFHAWDGAGTKLFVLQY